jgi:ornithine carbamoyltransferase
MDLSGCEPEPIVRPWSGARVDLPQSALAGGPCFDKRQAGGAARDYPLLAAPGFARRPHDTMNSLLRSVRNPRLDNLSPSDSDVLLANAHVLEQGGEEPCNSDLLRGRNLGLLCESEDADDAIRFRRAARNLGARVAFIRPRLFELSEPQTLRNTARMLGRLYDAVECQGLPADLVRQVGDEAGVPVYDGVASKRHPTASLAESLGGTRSLAENRQLVLQAALVSSIR